MEMLNTTHRPALADRIVGFVADLRESAARRAIYRRTVEELSKLSDRELNDIGLARANIEDVARDHAYGN